MLIFEDFCEQPRVDWSSLDVDAALSQVCFIEDQVSFLQLLKSKFSQHQNGIHGLFGPDWIRHRTVVILNVPLFGLNQQEVDVHLSQGLGQLSFLSGFQHMLQNCRGDPAEDRDVAHDVEASWRLDVGDDSAGLLLISEPLPEVLLLLWVSEPSHLCHHVNAFSRDLIGCCRPCGYPEASRGKQFASNKVYQKHFDWSRLCNIGQDLSVVEVQSKSTLIQTIEDEQNLELLKPADSCFFSFSEDEMKKFHQAVLLLFQQIELSEREWKDEL